MTNISCAAVYYPHYTTLAHNLSILSYMSSWLIWTFSYSRRVDWKCRTGKCRTGKRRTKKSGWKLKDHSPSYNKAEHSCTRRSKATGHSITLRKTTRKHWKSRWITQSCIFRSCIFWNIGPANSGPAFSGPPFSALPPYKSIGLLLFSLHTRFKKSNILSITVS